MDEQKAKVVAEVDSELSDPAVLPLTTWPPALPPRPCFGNRAVLEAACGHPIPDDVWAFVPWGRRLVVVRESPEQLYRGKIIIPPTAQVELTQGWVVSAGPLVGTATQPGAAGPSHFGPADLVERKVLFGKYAGTNFSAEPVSGEAGVDASAGYVILRDEDLYGELLAEPTQPTTTRE